MYIPLSTFMIGEERRTSDGKLISTRPVTRDMFTANSTFTSQQLLRVAAYARVSTDNEEQKTSYAAQVDYYTKYIKANPAWTYCGLYADEGISATNTAKREGFKKMIADAMDGKIDKILTKSVSRFARNTVDSLTTIRKLKEKGVGVYFEKENIDTLDSKGELLITLMSSLAQEESRSISQNTTWGRRKLFADGKVTMPFGHFLGYDRGDDGKPVVNEAEAEVVKLIYRFYLDGKSAAAIARHLMAQGIPTPGGVEKWQTTTIDSILQNERYKGDALLQKKFTVDFLTKKTKKNEGEVKQFYVRNSHPAIISAEVFDLAQLERHRRQKGHIRITTGSVLSGKLFCADCGGLYGSKVWNSNNKYRREVWQCNRKYGKRSGEGLGCSTPHVTEAQVQEGFIRLVNGLTSETGDVATFFERELGVKGTVNEQSSHPTIAVTDGAGMTVTTAVTDGSAITTPSTDIELEKSTLEAEITDTKSQMRAWIAEYARRAMPKEQYQKRYNELEAQLNTAVERLSAIDQTVLLESARAVQKAKIREMLDDCSKHGLVTDFDEALFGGLVDRIIVGAGRLVFILKDGREREVEM